MKFVDIKNDVAFRKIFGNQNKMEIIISFLNAVLGLSKGKRIKWVAFENPYQLPNTKGLKSSILDVRVTDERDISYIVEMQIEYPDGFDKRVQYYTAKQYSSQINTGDEYPKLNQVIFIGILDFDFFEGKDYLTKHLIINKNTGKQELKDLEFNFIELTKFTKKLKDIKTLVDKWIYFIKNAKNLEVIPANIKDTGLKHAYEDAEKHRWTKKELSNYDYAAMRKQDEKGKITFALKKGIREGMEKGLEKGLEKGIEKEKIETIIESVGENIPLSVIAKITRLTIEQVKKVIAEQNDNNHQ